MKKSLAILLVLVIGLILPVSGVASELCYSCSGTGRARCFGCLGDGECLNCSGDGGSYEYNFYSSDAEWTRCFYCGGTGNCQSCYGAGESSCSTCFGSGYINSYSGYSYNNSYSDSGSAYDNTQGNPGSYEGSLSGYSGSSAGSNTMYAYINDVEYEFVLSSAGLESGSYNDHSVMAIYNMVTDAGEPQYYLVICFSTALTGKSYDIIGDDYLFDLGIKLACDETGEYYLSSGSSASDDWVGSFTLTQISADGSTFDGYACANLQDETGNTIFIEIPAFHFTMTY